LTGSGLEFFSGFEVIRTAMEIEKKGHQFYSAMAQKAVHPLAQELFTWLAQDEISHLKTLDDMMTRFTDGAFWENEDVFLPYLKRFSELEIFPSAHRLEEIVRGGDFDIRSLDMAIEAEDRFAEFFRTAADHSRSPDGREAFGWLAGEEERHARQLRERREQLQGRSDS
jgi:rubrerythrin